MEYRTKVFTELSAGIGKYRNIQENTDITIVEYFCESEYIMAAMLGGDAITGPTNTALPVELERWENKTGISPVVIGQRFTLDGQHRGQYDQVIMPLKAQARLYSMAVTYADQAVNSEIWVRDAIGDVSFGGGGYIELGPQGAIGRLQPAVPSMNLENTIGTLTDAIHTGARYPKSRQGQIDQNIASAKFLEATAGVMNTAIRSYHLILKDMIEKALAVAVINEKTYFKGKSKVAYGILKNQEYLMDYKVSDLNENYQMRAEYGMGLGRSPSENVVMLLQLADSADPKVSQEFVQENIDGLVDVSRERRRIDEEKFAKMIWAKMLKAIEEGRISDRQLAEMAKARTDDKKLIDLYEKYVVIPQEEQQATMPTAGAPGLAGPGALPPGPDQQALPIPPAPPVDLARRINAPAGNGSFMRAGN
jgi:hypothetical protein